MAGCGRPTRAGTPCQFPGFKAGDQQLPCRRHQTEEDQAFIRGYEVGRTEARERYEAIAAWERQSQERRIETLEERLADATLPPVRTHTERGEQIVELSGYAYAWSGRPLEVGDVVEQPPNDFMPALTRTVTKVGSRYRGPLRRITRLVATKDELAPA